MVVARLLLAAMVIGPAWCFPAQATSNPCAEPGVGSGLTADFNATAVAQSRALRIVAITGLTTLYLADGKLFCHGVVSDNQGAATPMTITMSGNGAGRTMWVLRLDEAVMPAGLSNQ